MAELHGRGRMYDGHYRGFFYSTGEIVHLTLETVYWCKDALREFRRVTEQMVAIGVNTLPIVTVMALFVGMVLALQSGSELEQYGAKRAVGTLVGLTLVRELGPVMTGILVAGMAGSAISAQIGTMSVSEEIDALRTIGINPIRFLAMERFLAAIVMVPMLVMYTNFIGIIGGAVVSVTYLGLDQQTYFDNLFNALTFNELCDGMIKAGVFGAIVAVIGVYEGFKAIGGAAGVGKATTQSVVTSFMLILISDYFLSRLML